MSQARIVASSAFVGVKDYTAIFNWRTWITGWFLRVLSQVLFFAMLGELLGSAAQTRYLVIGNSVMMAAVLALFAVSLTTRERFYGTLPLLVASPARSGLVFAGRGAYLIGDGVVSAVGGLCITALLLDVAIPWSRLPVVAVIVAVVGASTYALGTFLAGLVIRRMSMRTLAVQVSAAVMMALCGVNVPVDYYPVAVQWVASLLPLTHGLYAIRQILDGSSIAAAAPHILAELAVGTAWMTLALLTFERLIDSGRRDGSVEFSA